jgi:hypothetical protein
VSEFLGLPLHPLVVHAVVVLVPLAAVGMVLAVASSVWAERLRVVVAVLATGAAVAAFVARSSGESLLARVPGSSEVARHADLSDALSWFLLGAAAVVVSWSWSHSQGRPSRVLGIVAAVGLLIGTAWTVLAGHSGAVSVWGDL